MTLVVAVGHNATGMVAEPNGAAETSRAAFTIGSGGRCAFVCPTLARGVVGQVSICVAALKAGGVPE